MRRARRRDVPYRVSVKGWRHVASKIFAQARVAAADIEPPLVRIGDEDAILLSSHALDASNQLDLMALERLELASDRADAVDSQRIWIGRIGIRWFDVGEPPARETTTDCDAFKRLRGRRRRSLR